MRKHVAGARESCWLPGTGEAVCASAAGQPYVPQELGPTESKGVRGNQEGKTSSSCKASLNSLLTKCTHTAGGGKI